MGLFRLQNIVLLLIVFLTAPQSHAGVQSYNEYQVKSVFILNLTSFVTWPVESFSRPTAPFKIVILGDDPFGAILDKTLKGESVQGHPIVVDRRAYREGLPQCHLLFISPALKRKIPDILANARPFPFLTVGDHAGFCRQGGMMNLIFRNNRVQIEANARAVEQSGLQINSKLLRVSIPF